MTISDEYYEFNKKIVRTNNLLNLTFGIGLLDEYRINAHIIMKKNDTGEICQTISMRTMESYKNKEYLSDNDIIFFKPILGIPIMFGMYDVYLDTKYKELQGCNYKGKYEKIIPKNDIEKIEKNFLRIYKIIRNCIVHNVENIKNHNGINIIEYNFGNKKPTKYYLEISDNALKYFYTATMLIMDKNIEFKRGSAYKASVLRWFYNEIVIDINDTLEDDIYDDINIKFQDELMISPRRDLIFLGDKSFLVYNQNNKEFIIDDSVIKKESDRGRDFIIEFNNNYYAIPEEILIKGSISEENMKFWNIDNSLLKR